jgi:hypothetical protein
MFQLEGDHELEKLDGQGIKTHLRRTQVAPKTKASLSSVTTMSMMPNLLSKASSASASPGAYLPQG